MHLCDAKEGHFFFKAPYLTVELKAYLPKRVVTAIYSTVVLILVGINS